MNSIRIRKVGGTALALLLVIGAFSGSLPTAMPLDEADLAGSTGTGFWDDPCTWDGFKVGVGVVVGLTVSWSGWVTAAEGLLRAVNDNCF